MKHKTLRKEVILKDIGIHSGKTVSLHIKPSNKGNIIFIDKTNPNNSLIVCAKNTIKNNIRATTLKSESMEVNTPEHFLSACAALEISSLEVIIDSIELPIFDGSSKPFFDAFNTAGIKELNQDNPPIIIKKNSIIEEKDMCIFLTPSDKTIFSYYLHYPHKVIQTQTYSIKLEKSIYEKEISPARTYGFESEIKHLHKQGLALGGSLKNALVIGEQKYINKPRFNNECARHKLLDLIGDLWILNRKIVGHITAIKSGHALNNTCLRYLESL